MRGIFYDIISNEVALYLISIAHLTQRLPLGALLLSLFVIK